MPLIILGLFVIVGIVIYALVQYGNSGDEDTRSVRERYPHAFPPKNKANIFDSFEKDVESEDGESAENKSSDGNTIHFPDNAELEKRKRNIN